MRKKSKESRLKEADKQRAERERALAVVAVKEAHKAIEEIEKDRKKPRISSLKLRIKININGIIGIFSKLSEMTKVEKDPISFFLFAKNLTEMFVRAHESIREDFRETMKISEDKLEKIFPKIDMIVDNMDQLIILLTSITNQEIQISAYLDRMI